MKVNLMILVHDRPVLMEATVHALMKQLPRRKVEKIILLANDPTAEVQVCAEKLASFYGLTQVVVPSEQRAWNTGSAVNYCIRQHPADVYIKMDDDIFITHPFFVDKMLKTIQDPYCGAAVALAPVSQFMGYYCIEKLGLLSEYKERFGQPWNTHWLEGSLQSCDLMLWLWEHTLNLNEATQKLFQSESGYVRTHEQVSIGTVCFTHAFWKRMGGFGVNQEQSLTKYLREIGYHFTIDTSNPVFHLGYNWCYESMLEKVFPRLQEVNRPLFAPPANYPGVNRRIGMIDIVIPMYNAVEYSKRCVASIRKTLVGIPYLMHLVDNGSTDGTRQWLESLTDSDVEIQTVPLNLGAPKGKNIILEHVQPQDYVLFIDNDIEFLPGWVEPFLDFFAAHEDAGILGIDGYNVTIQAEHRSLQQVSGDSPRPCHILRGCLMMARGELVRKLGGFEEKCGLYWHDDDDFCIRAIGEGYQNYVIPTDKVIHHGSQSASTLAHARNPYDSAKVQKYLVDKWRNLGLVDANGQPRPKVLK